MSAHEHTVLIVEDHGDSLEILEVLLGLSGFRVCGTLSGRDALARLRGGLRCCYVFLDWWLSDMSGDQFLAELRADPSLSHVPVLVYTGDPRVERLATACGVRHVFLKPVDPAEIVAVLAHHCPRSEPLPAS